MSLAGRAAATVLEKLSYDPMILQFGIFLLEFFRTYPPTF